MIKILGCFIVIISSSLIGYFYGNTYFKRVKQLRTLQYALNQLECEIIYTCEPLSEAFKNVGLSAEEPLKSILIQMAEIISSKEGIYLYDIYLRVLKQYSKDLFLEKEELEVIEAFIKALGSTDIEGQKKNFNITAKKLESFEKSAEEKRNKNEKLFRYLGVCTGMLIVIVLM